MVACVFASQESRSREVSRGWVLPPSGGTRPQEVSGKHECRRSFQAKSCAGSRAGLFITVDSEQMILSDNLAFLDLLNYQPPSQGLGTVFEC